MTYKQHTGSCRSKQGRMVVARQARYRECGDHTSRLGNPRGVSGLVCCGFLLFFFLFSFSSFSQKKTSKDSVVHFKVKYLTADYKFFPADGYLFMSGKNNLKITNTRNAKFEVKLIGGEIRKGKTDSTFEISGLKKPGNVLICVYETDAKGKKKLVVNKPFTVVPYPKVKFAGVACDSALSTIMLAAGTISVHHKGLNLKIPASGFKMEFYENEKFVLDSSLNNRLSKKMLAYVEKLKPGSLVYITDIKYKDPNGNEHTEPIYRVFIVKEDKVLKIGVN